MSVPKIYLHIDRLVLRGVAAKDRDAVVEALQQSLQDSLAASFGSGESDTSAYSRHVAGLRVPAFPVADPGPKAIGRAAGENLGRSLK